jgi:hypothetical protein
MMAVAAKGIRNGSSLDLLENLVDLFPRGHSLEVVSDDQALPGAQAFMAEWITRSREEFQEAIAQAEAEWNHIWQGWGTLEAKINERRTVTVGNLTHMGPDLETLNYVSQTQEMAPKRNRDVTQSIPTSQRSVRVELVCWVQRQTEHNRHKVSFSGKTYPIPRAVLGKHWPLPMAETM